MLFDSFALLPKSIILWPHILTYSILFVNLD